METKDPHVSSVSSSTQQKMTAGIKIGDVVLIKIFDNAIFCLFQFTMVDSLCVEHCLNSMHNQMKSISPRCLVHFDPTFPSEGINVGSLWCVLPFLEAENHQSPSNVYFAVASVYTRMESLFFIYYYEYINW